MQILEHCFRIYTSLEDLEKTVQFYEELQATTCTRRLVIAESGVAVAKVGGFLILAKDGEFPESVRQIQAIFYVAELEKTVAWCVTHGAVVLRAPHDVTAGRNATLRNPDGLVVEYFEAIE
jgi:predicted enzyme related to lactoylglutathione lyase